MQKLYKHICKNGVLYLCTFFGILSYFMFLFSSQDNDMFFEIMSGRDLLSGNFETASHLDNFPMIVQQWLYAVCLAIVDKFGYYGHISFVFIQNIILFILSSVFIYRKTNNKKLSLFGSFFAILFCNVYLINIRPQIITMILLIIELLILELYKEHKSIKYLVFIIPVLILAANFHQAIFFYHIMLLIPYYIDKNSKFYIDDKLVFITPLFIACSLCTPYTIDGYLYIFRTFASKTYDIYNIVELNALNIASVHGLKIISLLTLTIWYIYKHRSNIFINTYVFGISLLTLFNIRHLSVIYIAVLFLICNIDTTKLKNDFVYMLALIFTMITIIESSIGTVDINTNYGDIASIIENKDAKIYNSAMDLGGYLEYNGYTKVRIDSRCEAFSKEISGVENVNENLFSVKKGYKINQDFSYSLMNDKDILSIVEDYDYIIAIDTDYINKIATIENNWKEIYYDEDTKYIIYENISNK